MTRAGRKPLGPALVHHLDGSERAKRRLETILETIAGRLTVEEAAHQLGIEHAMFYKLRTAVLEASLACLEPRPMGRPPLPMSSEDRQIAELHGRVEELESELKLAAVREEIGRTLSHCDEANPQKKTPPARRQSRRQSARERKDRRR